MTTRTVISKGLADVAHTVEDSPYLRAVMAAALSERIASRKNHELKVVVDLAERVFGEAV